MKIEPKRFIQVYMEAYRLNKPMSYVAAKLGITRIQASGQARKHRRHGVDLPYLTHLPQPSADEIDTLNSMVERLSGGSE